MSRTKQLYIESYRFIRIMHNAHHVPNPPTADWDSQWRPFMMALVSYDHRNIPAHVYKWKNWHRWHRWYNRAYTRYDDIPF